MSRDRTETTPQAGYILVAVLGVMVLLTSFMAAGSMLVRSALDTAKVTDADVPIHGLIQAGIELTAYQLFVIKAAPGAIDGRRIKLGAGSITPAIIDEGGKADLNASDPKLLHAIFQSGGLDARAANALVAYIVDMRGADRGPQTDDASNAQAAKPDTRLAQPGAKKTLRGFQSVDQLQDFLDLTRSDLQALKPLLTVFNPDGKINILSASRELLTAIPGLSSADVDVILARRDSANKKDLEELLSPRQEAKAFIKTKFGPAYTVQIDATSAKNGRRKSVHAVLAASKSPNDPFYSLDWWE